MTALQIDAAQRVKTLIALTEELTAIFERENEALKARRAGEIAPLQEDKSRLAAAYAQSIRAIAADRGVVRGASTLLMDKLKAITRVFESRAAEQRALLDGASAAAEGLLKAVAAEAASAERSPAYDRAPTDAPRAAPLSVDERA
jgi:hypothetical protein